MSIFFAAPFYSLKLSLEVAVIVAEGRSMDFALEHTAVFVYSSFPSCIGGSQTPKSAHRMLAEIFCPNSNSTVQ